MAKLNHAELCVELKKQYHARLAALAADMVIDARADAKSIDDLRERVSRAEAEVERLKTALQDPVTVHSNILRGTINITRKLLIHAAHLPANVDALLAERDALRPCIERLTDVIDGLTQQLADMTADRDLWKDEHEGDCPVVAERDAVAEILGTLAPGGSIVNMAEAARNALEFRGQQLAKRDATIARMSAAVNPLKPLAISNMTTIQGEKENKDAEV